jgi:Large ribosomal RNA subunit accumulation protein YceD
MTRERLPFSRPVAIADLPSRGRDITVEASPEERALVARDFNLLAVEHLGGRYHVRRTSSGAKVRGEMKARIRQNCVVSLEPFDTDLEEPVELAFAAAATARQPFIGEDGVISVSLDEEDPPEPLVDGKVDLGAVTLEFLALGLDPYPRKPGVDFSSEFTPKSGDDDKPPSPFAVLAARRPKDDDTK